MKDGEIRLGVIGCGGFGLYALQQFAQVPGVTLSGMAGTHREAALAAARRFGIPDVEEVDQLLSRDDVDLVYIATPPFLHHPQAMAALEAGKHVICEKPLAMTLDQADAMIEAARRRDRLIVANLMQRYNPVYRAVARLIESRCWARSCTARSRTTPRTRICRPNTGSGTVRRAVASSSSTASTSSTCSPAGSGRARSRPPSAGFGPARHPRSRSTSSAPSATPRTCWSTSTMDSTRPAGWTARSCAWSSNAATSRCTTGCRPASASTPSSTRRRPALSATSSPAPGSTSRRPTAPATVRARGVTRPIDAYQTIELSWGEGVNKSHRYGELLRAMMADQAGWIRDRSHQRTINEANGRDSLAMAVQADRLAQAKECA